MKAATDYLLVVRLLLFSGLIAIRGEAVPSGSNYSCFDSWHMIENGENVVLPCLETVSNLSWRLAVNSLFESSALLLDSTKYKILENGSLFIANVTTEDYRTYLCEFKEGSIKAFVRSKNPDQTSFWIFVGIVSLPLTVLKVYLLIAEFKAFDFMFRRFKKPYSVKDEPEPEANIETQTPDVEEGPENVSFLRSTKEKITKSETFRKTKTTVQHPAVTKWKKLVMFVITNFYVCAQDVITDFVQALIHWRYEN